MELMMKLPDDMFKQELLPYMTVDDIVKLDNACMNHNCRYQLLEKISGVILKGYEYKYIESSLFKWLGMRRIYLIKMSFDFKENNIFSFITENDYVDQFRYTQHLFMIGSISDDMAIFVISHCPCLLSIDIGDYEQTTPQITDRTLQLIAEHCNGLQSLSLSDCREITDTGLITISKHYPHLKSFTVDDCDQITDTSIISMSTHCTALLLLCLQGCSEITDTSIISISTHCIRLQSLNLDGCSEITDDSIISISRHCTGLQSLNIGWCNQLTDASIMSLSTYCTGLQSLGLYGCYEITDVSIIFISENCKGLIELNFSDSNITDASLIAIAKNCT